MIFEPRKSRGLENLHGLIHAIKNHKILSFTYLNFWTGEKSDRTAEPYALKDFEHRWYLLAKDSLPKNGEKIMKTFALDRISDLDIKPKSFHREEYSVTEAFENSFGIIAPNGEKPQQIVLWFDAHQGNYIKSLPLHHSQEILKDDENGLEIKLFLVPTFDFKQAVLSYGERVKVLKPESFRKELRSEIENMMKFYKF